MGRGSSSSGGGGSSGGSFSGGGSSRGWSSSGSSRGRSSSSSRGWSSSSSRGNSSWGSSSSHNTVIIGGHSHYHGGGSSESNSNGIPIFIGIVFLLFGVVMIGLSINSFIQYNSYDTVLARCVDNTYIGGWYYTTYEYTVNGKEYEEMSDVGWEEKEVVGRYVTIYYLKDNPAFITEENPVDIDSSYPILIGGLIFGGVGVLLIVLSIKYRKKASSTISQSSEDSTSTPTTPEKETVHRCAYCGSKYDASQHSCPNCGADNYTTN